MTSTETFKSPERSQNMDTSTPDQNRKRPRPTDVDEGMREFFLQALKVNKDEIIKSFQLGLSEDYLKARRSIRLWSVAGTTEAEVWGNAGKFLHGPLAVPESDMGQDDVEAVFPVHDPTRPESIKDEVVVRFKSRKVRDMVMSHSTNLAGCVGPDGRPTEGTKLEIPGELKDTFCLLSRFGTRLRARHGDGTKRHVKFDDFAGSLFSNIKLPGDTKWTRVTPEMARSDLEASLKEENEANQRRLATKLVPGPRERLHRQAVETVPLQLERTARPPVPEMSAAGPSGKRPRWSGPQRRLPA